MEYHQMKIDDRRAALFAACVEADGYLSIEAVGMRYYSGNKTQKVLVYRHPELISRGLEIHIRVEEQYRQDKVTYELTSYFPYDYPAIYRLPAVHKMSSASLGLDLFAATKTITNGVKARKRAVKNGDWKNQLGWLANERENTGYALGIADQAVEMLNLGDNYRLDCDNARSAVTLRPGLSFWIYKDPDAHYMRISLTVDCSHEDMLDTIHLIKEYGYTIDTFSWENLSHRRPSLILSMNIDSAYDPSIFTVIESSRMFKRQIVNDIEEMQK